MCPLPTCQSLSSCRDLKLSYQLHQFCIHPVAVLSLDTDSGLLLTALPTHPLLDCLCLSAYTSLGRDFRLLSPTPSDLESYQMTISLFHPSWPILVSTMEPQIQTVNSVDAHVPCLLSSVLFPGWAPTVAAPLSPPLLLPCTPI